jgi:hypothetical protein
MFQSAKFVWNGGALNRYNAQTMPGGEPGPRAQFTYQMTPATISITGNAGGVSVGKDLEAVLRKIEYWHQAPVPGRLARRALGRQKGNIFPIE